MKKITHFMVEQTKIAQDKTALVPNEVYEKGEKAIKEWLIDNDYVDNALDYAETTVKITIYPE